MTGRDGNESNDPLAALNLPAAIRAQASKLLRAISNARPRWKERCARRIAPKALPWASKPCAR
jgi:hypothetical protein